jgi:hypothetical protein
MTTNLFYRLKMCLQKSNLCTAFFLWRRLARSFAALRRVSLWHPRCFVLNALCTRPLFIVFSCCFLPLPLSFLSVCSAALFRRPLLLGCSLSDRDRRRASAAATDAAVSEFVGSSSRLCKGESHSGASLALSPLLLGRLRALAFYSLSHSLTPVTSFSSFFLLLLRIRLFRPVPAIPPFLLKPYFSQGAVISSVTCDV